MPALRHCALPRNLAAAVSRAATPRRASRRAAPQMPSEATAAWVKSEIASAPVVVFSKSYCPCVQNQRARVRARVRACAHVCARMALCAPRRRAAIKTPALMNRASPRRLSPFHSYCAKAKSALSPLVSGKALVWHELDHMDNGSEIQAALAFTGATSVPRVFVGGKFIGGGDDTAALARSGELKRMIDAARA